MVTLPITYEYAGFVYDISHIPGRIIATPLEDQHPSANKEKHRRAAVECFIQDHPEIQRKDNR